MHASFPTSWIEVSSTRYGPTRVTVSGDADEDDGYFDDMMDGTRIAPVRQRP